MSAFDRIDANHDGVISREEFAQMAAQMAPAAPTMAYGVPPVMTYAAPAGMVMEPLTTQIAPGTMPYGAPGEVSQDTTLVQDTTQPVDTSVLSPVSTTTGHPVPSQPRLTMRGEQTQVHEAVESIRGDPVGFSIIQPKTRSTKQPADAVYTQGLLHEIDAPQQVVQVRESNVVAGQLTQHIVEIPTVQEVVEEVEVPEVQVVKKYVEVPPEELQEGEEYGLIPGRPTVMPYGAPQPVMTTTAASPVVTQTIPTTYMAPATPAQPVQLQAPKES